MKQANLNSMGSDKIAVSWSGGKDSCIALWETQKSSGGTDLTLMTTLTSDYDRISMHGVRRELLQSQAQSLGLPLVEVWIPKNASNDQYETRFLEGVNSISPPVDAIIFGDLFLEDVKNYRDSFLARHGLKGRYPIWQRNTGALIQEFIQAGFKAIVTCVDGRMLDHEFVGRNIDEQFVSSLPPNVDPCGENGEFHTFVFDGPNFAEPVEVKRGEIVQRDGFWFCDLLPNS